MQLDMDVLRKFVAHAAVRRYEDENLHEGAYYELDEAFVKPLLAELQKLLEAT